MYSKPTDPRPIRDSKKSLLLLLYLSIHNQRKLNGCALPLRVSTYRASAGERTRCYVQLQHFRIQRHCQVYLLQTNPNDQATKPPCHRHHRWRNTKITARNAIKWRLCWPVMTTWMRLVIRMEPNLGALQLQLLVISFYCVDVLIC